MNQAMQNAAKSDLQATEFTYLCSKTNRGQQVHVAAYVNTFNGREYFHVRELWQNDKEGDKWMPGKGLSVPAEQRHEMCAALGALVPVRAKRKAA